MKLFKRVDKVLAKHDAMEEDIKRRDGVPEPAIPAGSLIATRTGNVAHVKSGLPGEGALCQEMRLWTGWRVVRSGEVLKMCHRCELARDGRAAS